MDEQKIIRLINSKRKAIEENLLLSSQLKEIKEKIKEFLDEKLTGESILALRYKKFKVYGEKTLWSDLEGYPSNGLKWINPWIDFFEKYIAEKTIKRRLKNENLWVEARTRGNELHLLAGEKDKNGKIHVVIDEITSEIRIDKKDRAPNSLLKKIDAILTTKNGKKIKTTMQFLEEEE
ncbi:hypothetical protein ES703_109039 [subsurface metagenome]